MKIVEALSFATKFIPCTWPLQSFVASNPLWDCHDMTMIDAIKFLKKFIPINGFMPISYYYECYHQEKISSDDILQAVNEQIKRWYHSHHLTSEEFKAKSLQYVRFIMKLLQMTRDQFQNEVVDDYLVFSNHFSRLHNAKEVHHIQKECLKFCCIFFDAGQASWIFPFKDLDLFPAWKKYISSGHSPIKTITGDLSDNPLQAITQLVTLLKITEEELPQYFANILLSLIGWSSFIKWIESHPNNPFIDRQASLASIVAIWLCYEVSYLHELNGNSDLEIEKERERVDHSSTNEIDWFLCKSILQYSFELNFQKRLLHRLRISHLKNFERKTIAAQAVFCIDVRSEGIRRHLEAVGPYATEGFAGFFAFAFQKKTLSDDQRKIQAPALINPTVTIAVSKNSNINLFDNIFSTLALTLKNNKKYFLTPLALFELIGYWALLPLLKNSFFYRFFSNKSSDQLDRFDVDAVIRDFGLDFAAQQAAFFLKSIGMFSGFAKLILICGHAAKMNNNPFKASFDCGACGGNSGLINAMVACSLLNHSAIREQLRRVEHIEIPNSTYFVAGCHDTTTDKVTVVEENVPKEWQPLLSQLQRDLDIASIKLRQERLQQLPGRLSPDSRAVHWAEIIPEMGLINNAAMIIGPRQLTDEADLQRQVFLHSYHPELDADGKILETILTAPVVVAHWINAQYYFSTTDPTIYGSGNKTLHNVVSRLGVIEGNFSDLKIGLPLQSISFRDQILHEPRRLLVVIYAPTKRVDDILLKHPEVKSLFDGDWAHLHIIDPENRHDL